LFCGISEDKEGKPKKQLAIIEPVKPLACGLYRCDSRFHTEVLAEQLENNLSYGFIIVDGSGVTFHSLNGNARKTLFKLEVMLPKKHGRGGQSKNRFARIREEKRGWYTSKVAAMAVSIFIDPISCLPNVQGVVLAGSAQLKEDVQMKLDQRLARIVIAVVDIQYGGESGFNQAINLTKENLSSIKFVQEQEILSRLFEEISKDGHYAIGIEDTMYALTSGLLETLILFNDLQVQRIELSKTSNPEEKKVVYVTPEKKFEEKSDWTVVSQEPLLDWILDHYKEFGAKIEIVSDQTNVGAQFVKGFGGLGGLLRYEAELPSTSLLETQESDDECDYEYTW